MPALWAYSRPFASPLWHAPALSPQEVTNLPHDRSAVQNPSISPNGVVHDSGGGSPRRIADVG
ncbi:hypothetical protein AB0897_31565, partial [Streptomyces sp. NPDC007168]|uniref:hypothetical protein n=1 Tax=Streptomyces sp. NPDC007168 TaxID=3156919 RepID=UPI003454DD59